MLPTFKDVKSDANVDFLGNGNGITEASNNLFSANNGNNIIALNHMALCPPACPDDNIAIVSTTAK